MAGVPERKDGPPKKLGPPWPKVELGKPGPDGFYGSGWDLLDLGFGRKPPPKVLKPAQEERPEDRSDGDDPESVTGCDCDGTLQTNGGELNET